MLLKQMLQDFTFVWYEVLPLCFRLRCLLLEQKRCCVDLKIYQKRSCIDLTVVAFFCNAVDVARFEGEFSTSFLRDRVERRRNFLLYKCLSSECLWQ